MAEDDQDSQAQQPENPAAQGSVFRTAEQRRDQQVQSLPDQGTRHETEDRTDYAAFHRMFAGRAARKGWLYIAFLQHEGCPIAGRYGFLYRGVYYAYQSGFDPAMAESSPGEVLLGMVLEDMIRRGVHEFNFLRGDQPHKFHWTDARRQTLRLEGWARTGVGHALAALDRVAALRRRVRRMNVARAARVASGGSRP